MTATLTGQQLYPETRLRLMSTTRLNAVLSFALADVAETNHTCVYLGMDRGQTVLTARRTIDDVNAELGRRAAKAFAERCGCA